MNDYFAITKSLGDYMAFEVKSISDEELVFRVDERSNDSCTEGHYSISIYQNGEWNDIMMNEWTFSKMIRANYKAPFRNTNNSYTSYTINALSPKGEEVQICYRMYGTYLTPKSLIESLYSVMKIVSAVCKTKEEAEKISKLFILTSGNSLSEIVEQLRAVDSVLQVIKSLPDIMEEKKCLKKQISQLFDNVKINLETIII